MASPEDLPPPRPTADEVREAAEEVLSRPEFREPPKSLWDRVVEAISEVFDELIASLVGGGRSAIAAWIALAVVIAVIGFLIVRIVSSTRRDPSRGAGFAVATEVRRPAVEWEQEADHHAREGRWRDAVRCRYRALVARLASAGAVDEVPGRTAGEYRNEVRRTRPDMAPPFGEATDLFERAWYGRRPTGEDEERRLRELSDRVLERAGS